IYIPEARCRHLYNQSAGRTAGAADVFARSERQYLEKWIGKRIAGWIKGLERAATPAAAEPWTGAITLPRSDVVLGASAPASFESAAGHFPDRARIDVPAGVWQSYLGEALYVRVVDRASARVLATYVKAKIAPA